MKTKMIKNAISMMLALLVLKDILAQLWFGRKNKK